jgi:hypothetical protein
MNTAPSSSSSSSSALLKVMTASLAMEPAAHAHRVSPIPFDDTTVTCKRVLFDAHTTTCSTASPLDHAQSCLGDIWYNRDEIAAFRETSRAESRRLREQYQDTFDHESDAPCPMLVTVNDDEMRGLEQRACPERQRRKYITRRVIFKASQHDHGERLGRIAAKCTGWATQLALVQGEHDFERAHSESLPLHFQQQLLQPPNRTASAAATATLRWTSLKRGVDATVVEATRRVRSRLPAVVCS